MPRPAYDQVQNQLLETCKRLFLSGGIRDTEMQQIAAEAGISRSTLYRYITDKDQLVFMAATDLMFEMTNRCLGCAVDANKNGYEKMKHFSHILTHELAGNPGFVRFLAEFDLIYGGRSFDTPEARMYAEGMDKLIHREAQFLFEGLSDGSIRPMEDPMLYTAILIHTIYGLAKSGIAAELLAGSAYTVPDERVINSAVDVIIAGVRA